MLKEAKKLFEDSLEVEEEVIIVDSRCKDGEGMIKLKGVLKKRRADMIVSVFFYNFHCM